MNLPSWMQTFYESIRYTETYQFLSDYFVILIAFTIAFLGGCHFFLTNKLYQFVQFHISPNLSTTVDAKKQDDQVLPLQKKSTSSSSTSPKTPSQILFNLLFSNWKSKLYLIFFAFLAIYPFTFLFSIGRQLMDAFFEPMVLVSRKVFHLLEYFPYVPISLYMIYFVIYVPLSGQHQQSSLPNSKFSRFVSILLSITKIVHAFVVLFYLIIFLYTMIWLQEPLTAKIDLNQIIPSSMCDVTALQHEAIKTYSSTPVDEFEINWNQVHSMDDFMKQYISLHQRIRATTQKEKKKYVLFRAPLEGLGNRIHGLLSTFLLAAVTNRAFAVNWRTSMNHNAKWSDLFEDLPFVYKDSYAWNDIPFEKMAYGGTYVNVGYCRPCPVRPIGGAVFENLLCGTTVGIDENSALWEIESTQFYAPFIAANPNFRWKVCKLLQGSNDLFGTLYHALIKPSRPVKELMTTKMKEMGLVQNQYIGIQIRRLENYRVSEQSEQTFWRCASALSSEMKWFLATDNEQTKQKWLRLVGSNRLVFFAGEIARHTIEGVQQAFAEALILSQAKELVVSPYSSFGSLAHGIASKRPFIVARNNRCMQQITSQPCSYVWFKLAHLKCFNPKLHYISEMINNEDCYYS